ncbi:IgG-binding virulence factor TspB family protein [Neisseria meningitidis]|uniref:IgG-binding virulence factor TspB family protein n=1 Tax=Neisseria meningitidis TaxID=487 RepID=UPI001303FDE5
MNGGDCLVAKGDDGRTFISFSLQGNSKYKEEMDAKKAGRDFIVESRCQSRQIHKGNRISRLFRKSRSRTRNKSEYGPVTDRNGNPFRLSQHSAGIRKATPQWMFK